MRYIKTYESINEAKKFGAKEIMKAFKNKDDWGDAADQVYMKGGNMVYVDSWFYGSEKAMKQLEDSWKKGGSNYDYWNKEYGVDFKIVDTFTEIQAEGRHKKLTTDGIVGVVLKVTPGTISEAKEFQDTPNEFAYLDFKKWAYKNRGKIKKKLTGITDGTQLFIALKKVWMEWSNKNAKEWSYLHSTPVAEKDFGRALAIMLKTDDLIIKKSGNKLIDLK
jgi:hypothetical protein